MFELCLFDLDDTLIHTTDLKEIREACKNNADSRRIAALKNTLGRDKDRLIYDERTLKQIRSKFPDIKLGIFTRSPRSYALTLLEWAYPNFIWDVVIAYEDVTRTKPYGNGIHEAMDRCKIEYVDRVILVGDTDPDVRSSYNAGCWVALSTIAWPDRLTSDHWRALEHVPDAFINSSEEILEVLSNLNKFLPHLEFLLTKSRSSIEGLRRFDKINHFVARSVGNETTAYPIYVCGRSFSNYESVAIRKEWHDLTTSIEENKESDQFPTTWIQAIRHFIEHEFDPIFGAENIAITVIPHRPRRKPRLENLLSQLRQSIDKAPIDGCNISFHPELLAYKAGVKSQHNDFLNRDERFTNVQDNLFVNEPKKVNRNTSYIVIDDVTTTGASLIFACKYLKAAGALNVKCLSMAKNVGNVL